MEEEKEMGGIPCLPSHRYRFYYGSENLGGV